MRAHFADYALAGFPIFPKFRVQVKLWYLKNEL